MTAQVVPFADLVHARQRRRQRALAQQCVDLIELNLRLAVERFAAAPVPERPVYARRIRVLGEPLEYAQRAV